MYLLAKFGGNKSCGNEDTSSCINANMITSEEAKFTAWICYIERFSKSGIPIYNSVVPKKMGRRIQAITKRYA